MILISHRGNVDGKKEVFENHPDYINNTLNNYDVEIDVWYIDKKFYLGHDEPMYNVEKSFLQNDKLWCHAKNIDALNEMLKCSIHCFFHNTDEYTLTSKGYIWTYPGFKLTEKSICVLPEQSKEQEFNCLGICSDFIMKYK